jgi:hypothetical protein
MRDLTSFAWSGRRAKSACVAIVALVAWLVDANTAFAEASAADKQEARAAYTRATEANERGDFAVAARELALADELVPNVVTLKAALDAALDADAPVLGMELVVRSETRAEAGAIADVAASARKRFSGRVGRVHVVCAGPAACTATLDGDKIAVSEERFVLTGKHIVIVTSDGHSITREVDVAPMALAIVQASTTNVSPSSAPGLSPAWFAAGIVSTVAAGIGTAISGADTMKLHDEFVGAHCSDPGPASACVGLASDGQSAQLRTNVLVGVTAALGLSTVILGVVTFGKKNASSGQVSAMSIEPRRDGVFARLVLVLP